MDGWSDNGDGTSSFVTRSGDVITVGNSHLANGGAHGLTVGEITRTDPDYHEYHALTNLGYQAGNQIVPPQIVNDGLRANPTPTGPYFAGPGFVSHYFPNESTVVNITTNAHSLDPGVVKREVVIIDGQYYIKTTGMGAGILPEMNNWAAPPVWTQADVSIMLYILKVTGLAPNPLQAGAVDPEIGRVQKCFLAGTPISMWDGTKKPIEFVKPGDLVTSYDKDGNLVPGRVSKTKENRVKHILDVFGLMVTPGHVTLCGEGKFEGQHVPMIDILRSDSALVLEDGSMKRAATNFAVGSTEDRFVQAIVTEDVPGTDSVRVVESGQIRLGTRFMHPTGADITVLEIIQRTGGSLTDDGYVVLSDGITKTPFVWTFTNRLPKPEDFVLQRSQVTLADIYEADEWEAVAPQVPPPYRGEAGPSFASINGGLKAAGHEDNRPSNIPVSMRGTANQPTMSRKQRRAHAAKQRKQAKRMVRTAH